MADFAGKVGLVVGVANKRSLSWAIARATRRAAQRSSSPIRAVRGARRRTGGYTHPRPLVLPLDVTATADRRGLFEDSGGARRARLRRPRRRVCATRRHHHPFVQTSREGFELALDISAYSLIALARGAQPLMEARGGGSIVTLTYLGSTRVFPNYNVMGVAKPP